MLDAIDLKSFGVFASVFGVIFLAELPDKTAINCMLLGSKYKPTPVFIGVALAFLIHMIVAVVFGGYVSALPKLWISLASAILFFIFSYLELRPKGPEKVENFEGAEGGFQIFLKSFLLIFFAEFGDLTQILTATMAAENARPLLTLVASTSALWLISLAAILSGKRVLGFFGQQKLARLAGVVFFIFGAIFLAKFYQELRASS